MSSTMPDLAASESPRRRLTERQADLVGRLVDAAVDELRGSGYEGLTVRNVARGAGVAAATAYTYFGSKDHLVAEVFWRRIATLPPVRVDRRRSPAARVGAAFREVGLLVADEPEVAAACTTALLSSDAEVRHLRDRIGFAVHQRAAAALGDDADPAVLRALDLTFSGAMLQAGMGHLSYDDLADRMAEVATLILGAKGDRR